MTGATTSPAVLQLHGDAGPAPWCTFVIREEITHLGRDPACEVILTARNVSRRHARIVFHQDDYVLEDLGSKTGTLLNGVRLEHSVLLHDGDQIGIGASTFTFTFAKKSSDDELKVEAESTILGVRDVSSTAAPSMLCSRRWTSRSGSPSLSTTGARPSVLTGPTCIARP